MCFSKINSLALSVFVAAMAMMTSVHAAQSVKIRIQPTKACSINEGDTDIPVIHCLISTGIKTSDIKKSALRLNADKNVIPYIDAPSHWELGPFIVEKNGVYAVQMSFLDDSIDGFGAFESKYFLKFIIELFEDEPNYMSIDVAGSVKVDQTQVGRILK